MPPHTAVSSTAAGAAPNDRLTGNDTIPARYEPREAPSKDSPPHPGSNVVDSDAAVIFLYSDFKSGSLKTSVFARMQGKPQLHRMLTPARVAGVPLPVVQALCEHGSPAIQAKYIHIGVDAAAQAVAAMPHTQGNHSPPFSLVWTKPGLSAPSYISSWTPRRRTPSAAPSIFWRTHHEQQVGM